MPHVAAGLQHPAAASLPRRPGSVRRTTHVDMAPAGHGVVLSSAARDLLTWPDGRTAVRGAASLEAEVAADRSLIRLEVSPPDARVGALVGRAVATGFRAALDELLPDHRAAQTPLYLLLEELPVATLISGYATLYRQPAEVSRRAPALPSDICAGWRADGLMMRAIDRTGQIPIPVGPMAPALDVDDPLGWHPMDPLARGAMRRRRLVDVARGDPAAVSAMFRDTHVEPDGTETVLHEYHVTATVDPAHRRVLSCQAVPHVLPWPECPAAADSARRLEGQPVAELRTLVRRQLRGTSTCTHLNDVLRSLGDVEGLLRALEDQLPV